MDKEKTMQKLKQEIEEVQKKCGVDFAEVVRCKNCKHHEERFGASFCKIWMMFNGAGDEGFCNYGVRRNKR